MTQYDAGEDHYKMMILDFQFYVVWAGLKCNICGLTCKVPCLSYPKIL